MHAVMKELKRAVYQETLSTLEVLKLIAELDEKGHYLKYGYSSLYQYLRSGLFYSEGAANRRIRAARLLRKEERASVLFQERKISLCTMSLISDKPEFLEKIAGKSKREVEELLAVACGKDTAIQERILPVAVVKKRVSPVKRTYSTTATTEVDVSGPLIEERLKITFSVSKEDSGLMEEVKEILSHRYPHGASVEELFLEGLRSIRGKSLKKRTVRKHTSTATTKSTSRYVPAKLKREVLKRDNYCCSYRHQGGGSVCGSKWQVEIDHIRPVAFGGRTEGGNLRVLCRKHNQMAAKDVGLGDCRVVRPYGLSFSQ